MSDSMGPSVVAVWQGNADLATAKGLWLNFAANLEDFPYATFEVRPGRSIPSFGDDVENQYAVEFNVYALDETVARSFLGKMDTKFHLTQFPMAAPEQCMSSIKERPGEVRLAGVDKKNRPVYRARCVYQVRVFVPAS